MTISEKIYKDLVALEKKMWNREDYSEEDIPLFSSVMDFITDNRTLFMEYFDSEQVLEINTLARKLKVDNRE